MSLDRQVVLDIETTGLDISAGNRIIEVACVELLGRRVTGIHKQFYINPEHDVEDGAYAIHGISNEFLSDKPVFADIAQVLIDFIRDTKLVIHNAPFDVSFLNAELARLDSNYLLIEDYCRILDTLQLARQKRPGEKNTLDALAAYYDVQHPSRELHGALLDANILVDVYLKMTGGQSDFQFSEQPEEPHTSKIRKFPKNENGLIVIQPNAEEQAQHQKILENMRKLNGKCLWDKLTFN